MNDSLGDLLRRSADAAPDPRLDVEVLVARADRRQRHRRLALAAAAAGVVGAVVVGSLVVRSGQPRDVEPAPSPSPSPPGIVAVEPDVTRPVVYAEGSTVHVGDRTIEAHDPVAFLDVTDDGVVYEAALDCTLWFTDGTTTSVIGTTMWTAAPTARVGSVVTSDSGSLVVWRDVTDCRHQRADQYAVYDTSRREVVGHIPIPEGGDPSLLYVDEDHVYFNPDPDSPGCWVVEIHDIHHCPDPHLFRFDVTSGETTKISVAELEAEAGARVFVRPPASSNDLDFGTGAGFRQVDNRLVSVTAGGDPTPLTLRNGDEVRLRVPDGYRAPGLEWGGSVIRMSQWLDDQHIVVWANEGGGDLPPQLGDLLVCRLPDGVCRVGVPQSSDPYVAPNRG